MADHSINIPKLGMSMVDGTVSAWLVQDGERVATGQPIYLLETDKTEAEIEASADGVISLTGVLGETYPVGTQIGVIHTD